MERHAVHRVLWIEPIDLDYNFFFELRSLAGSTLKTAGMGARLDEVDGHVDAQHTDQL